MTQGNVNRLAVGLVAVTLALHASPASANIFKDVADVATAPARAAVHVVEDASKGKAPSVDEVLKVASPSFAQANAADKKLGVTKTLKNAADLPNKATDAVNKAKELVKHEDERLKETHKHGDALLSKVAQFLESLSTPIKVVLWGLVAFLFLKVLGAMKSLGAPSSRQKMRRAVRAARIT